jgi:hypothetical protein
VRELALKPVPPYARRSRIVANSRVPVPSLARPPGPHRGIDDDEDGDGRTRVAPVSTAAPIDRHVRGGPGPAPAPAQHDARAVHAGTGRPANFMRESFAEHVRCTVLRS